MEVLITFINPNDRDGAYNRLRTLSYIYNVSNILYVYKHRGYFFNELLRDDCVIYSKKTKANIFFQLKSFLFSKSLFGFRCFLIDQNLNLLGIDNIICHTSRSYNILSKNNKLKVSHVDLCDNLFKGYFKSSFFFLKRLKLISSISYFLEAFRELATYVDLKNTSTSLITDNDKSKFLPYNIISIPNIYPEYSIQNEFLPFIKIRFGIIGNFRTVLNQNILDNFKLLFPNNEVHLFGNCDLHDLDDKISFTHGKYEKLSDITHLFDIGFCVSPLQAGIQNKVIEYLFANKLVFIDQAVWDSFYNDSVYKALCFSPFVFRCPKKMFVYAKFCKSLPQEHLDALSNFKFNLSNVKKDIL